MKVFKTKHTNKKANIHIADTTIGYDGKQSIQYLGSSTKECDIVYERVKKMIEDGVRNRDFRTYRLDIV